MIKQKYLDNIYKIFLLFVSGVVVGSFSIFPMILIQKVIDSLKTSDTIYFIKYIILYTLIYIFVDTLKIILTNLGSKFELSLNKKIKAYIVDHFLNARVDLLENYGRSNAFNLILDDLKELDNKLVKLIFGLGFSVSSFIIGAIIIIKYDYVMLIVMLIISVLSTLLIKKILKKSDAAVKESQIQRLSVINRLFDIIIGARDIKLFNKEDIFRSEFHEDNCKLYCSDKKIVNIKNVSQTLISLLFNLIMALLILIGGLRVSKGNLSVGALVAIILYASMITDPIFNIIENQKELYIFKNAIKRLDSALDFIKEEIIEIEKDFNVIEFKNVRLNYGDNTIIDAFNFVVISGDKIKVNGRTGAGKSSLVKLFTNMYKPTSGVISIDGRRDKYISVSAVFQENKLFNMSILENITFKSDISDSKLKEIIRICKLREVIDRYSSNSIGFDSSSLSGGERTRLLIARALCKDCELYIFDEISTGLDEALFYEIFNGIMEFLSYKTVIVIDHKFIDERHFNKNVFI